MPHLEVTSAVPRNMYYGLLLVPGKFNSAWFAHTEFLWLSFPFSLFLFFFKKRKKNEKIDEFTSDRDIYTSLQWQVLDIVWRCPKKKKRKEKKRRGEEKEKEGPPWTLSSRVLSPSLFSSSLLLDGSFCFLHPTLSCISPSHDHSLSQPHSPPPVRFLSYLHRRV